MIRKSLFLGLGLIGLIGAGCKDFDGPRQLRGQPRPDLPQYSIEEQQSRGRGRYGIPEDDPTLPKAGVSRPSPTGR